jgi:hypothetical protein
MKKKTGYKKFRIPLPKQRCQAFKSEKDYDRKKDQKNWKRDSGSFLFLTLDF